MEHQKFDISYYNQFSKVYDWISPKVYYHQPRAFAIQEMNLKAGQSILNIPCGTGQNFEYFQEKMNNSGQIIGIDLSEGMLSKAKDKIQKNKWNNITLIQNDATQINVQWVNKAIKSGFRFDSIFCDLGLSGFSQWEAIIDNLIALLKPDGRIVIMDWYIAKPSLRGSFIKWIGKGEVNRPLWQYLEKKVTNFSLNDTFKNGDMFVASGNPISS